jgi:hypothetical protein
LNECVRLAQRLPPSPAIRGVWRPKRAAIL